MTFTVEIASITETINGNPLALSVGGLRAYNLDNLRGRKSPEKFKLFIGFQNRVCTNLCVSTDGFQSEVKVMNLHDLFEKSLALIQGYDSQKHLREMMSLPEYGLTESQFAHMIGKAKMYQFLPVREKKNIPLVPFSDSQVSTIARNIIPVNHSAGIRQERSISGGCITFSPELIRVLILIISWTGVYSVLSLSP